MSLSSNYLDSSIINYNGGDTKVVFGSYKCNVNSLHGVMETDNFDWLSSF